MPVDLNTCLKGQLLRSKHGEIWVYVGKSSTPSAMIYPHIVQYIKNKNKGSRTNEGFVYRNPQSRLPGDHDIVEILDDYQKKATLVNFESTGSVLRLTPPLKTTW